MDDRFFPIPPPTAWARLRGDTAHPRLSGEVLFSPYGRGTLVTIRAAGLPVSVFLGLHIHEKGVCATGGDVAFASAGGHFDPHNVPHPLHAGDLPPLLSSAEGTAAASVWTDRFTPAQVLGRSVILHGMADDFRSQPSGDSGGRIACGLILPLTPR